MNDKLFEILREYSNNTLACHAKISAYIAELLSNIKQEKPEEKLEEKPKRKKKEK